MASSERITQVQEAITTHLKTVGPSNWDEIKKDFLDIPTSSFWRYVKNAKEQIGKPIVSSVATDLFAHEERSAGCPESPNNPKLNSVFRLLSHTQRFYELHSDLLALRQHALDADGRIRDPQLFAKTIRLRNQLLNDELHVTDGIARADINTKFFDAVIEAVTKVSPEVAKAIIGSLSELNEEIGDSKNSKGCA